MTLPISFFDAAPVAFPFQVVGLFQMGFNEYDSRLAFVNLVDARRLGNARQSVFGVELRFRDPMMAMTEMNEVERRLGPEPRIIDWKTLNYNLFMALTMQKLIIADYSAALAQFEAKTLWTYAVKGQDILRLKQDHPQLVLQRNIDLIRAFRDSPAGHVRITVPRPAVRTVIEPILSRFLRTYPAVTLEVVVDSALTDIVRDRFDAGIRPGHRVEQDMIALRVGEDSDPTVVGSPDYLARHGAPREPRDLQAHNCTRIRFASSALHRWTFEKRGRSIEVDVAGSLITGDGDLAVRASLDGVALARVPRYLAEPHLAAGTLVTVLEDWRPRSVGFYLYYPSRRQMPAALQALIDTLKTGLTSRTADKAAPSPALGKPSARTRRLRRRAR